MSTAENSSDVAANFDRAARNYDSGAHIQRLAAQRLAQKICDFAPAKSVQDILELGCGTGFLTEQLVNTYSHADWTITDISPQMLAQCRRKLQRLSRTNFHGSLDYQIQDARSLGDLGTYDLIQSNFTFQWFEDLGEIVADLLTRLRPGGTLAFNTLGAETFRYWQQLDRDVGGKPSAPVFPTLEAVQAQISEASALRRNVQTEILISTEELDEYHPSLLGFLRNLNTIGAGGRIRNTIASMSNLRKVIRRSVLQQKHAGNERGIKINYQVISVLLRLPY